MARVPVLKPLSGELVYVEEADFAAAKAEGYGVPTPQEVAQVELEAEYGGTLNQIGAGATGVASGLTLGLSDIALSELGGRERLAAYESLYPTERKAGTVAGAVLPALLSAGASAPASGASLAARALAATPAALAMRAGAGAAAGLGLAATRGVAQGIGRTALRLGVSAGVESAIQGAGFEAGKLAIDNKLSGEHLGQIAAAGLTSGALGLGLGSGIGALSAVASKAYAALPSGAGAGETLSKGLLKLRGRFAGKSVAEIDKIAELAQPEVRSLALNAEKELAESVGPLQADLDARHLGQQQTAMYIRDGSLKIKTLRGEVAADAPSLMRQRSFAIVERQKAVDAIDDMIARGRDEYNPNGLRSLRHELVRGENEMNAAIALSATPGSEAAGAEALFGVLDTKFKRAIGTATSRFSESTKIAERRTREVLRSIYDAWKNGLEDQSTWGRAGVTNREMNAPMHQSFSFQKSVSSNWMEGIESGVDPFDPWRSNRVSSPTKILENLKSSNAPGINSANFNLRKSIEKETEWQAVMIARGNIDEIPGARAALEGQARLNARILERLDKGKKIAEAKATLESISGPSDSFLSMMAGAAIGSGNPLFAVMTPLLKPRLVLRGAEMLESVARGGNASIATRAAKAAAAISATAVDVGKKAAIVGSSAAEFDKKSKRVASLAEQTPAIAERIARDTEWAAPAAQREAVDTAVRQVDYLRSNLPQGLRAPTPFSQDLPATRAQVQGWLMRLRTVENPASLLDDVANGKLSPEAVDAVRTVYPAMFADMQARVVEKLLKLQNQGRAPSFAARAQLALLLGMPTDPLLMPSSMRAIQAQYAAQPGAAQGGAAPAPGRSRKVPQLAGGFRTGSDETALTSDQP